MADSNADVDPLLRYITSLQLLEVRNAGYSDAQIVEIITHVGLNILTNMLGKASQLPIDFPAVDLKLAS